MSDLVGNVVLLERKKNYCHFPFFFQNWLGLKSVSFKLISLFLRRVALVLMYNLINNPIAVDPNHFLFQEFRPPRS